MRQVMEITILASVDQTEWTADKEDELRLYVNTAIDEVLGQTEEEISHVQNMFFEYEE